MYLELQKRLNNLLKTIDTTDNADVEKSRKSIENELRQLKGKDLTSGNLRVQLKWSLLKISSKD